MFDLIPPGLGPKDPVKSAKTYKNGTNGINGTNVHSRFTGLIRGCKFVHHLNRMLWDDRMELFS